MRVQLQGRVKIYPTEDSDKVRQAVGNLFPLSKMELVEEGNSKVLTFEGEGRESLARLQAVLRQEHIRDAVRRVLHEKVEGDRIRFCLNKQVAYVGCVSICEPMRESPLGPIEVEIETDDHRGLIDWLSPASPHLNTQPPINYGLWHRKLVRCGAALSSITKRFFLSNSFSRIHVLKV